MLVWLAKFIMHDSKVFLSWGRSLMAFHSFRSLLITSFHAFLRLSSWEITTILKGSACATDQKLFFNLSRRLNQFSLLSCKYSLMLFTLKQLLRSLEKKLILKLNIIYLTILAPFLPSLIFFSPWTGQGSLPYNRTLCTHAE